MRYAAICTVVLLLLLGCAKETEPQLPPLTASEISGERLWKRITFEADWDTYASWPGLKGMQPGQSPHGKFHEVYVNAPLARSLPIPSRTAPEGSIIVKENFDSSRKPTVVSVMAKVTGYNPEYGDWFWAVYDTKGKAFAQGKVEQCIECHEGVKDNDYIILHQLDAALPGN